MIDTNEQVIFLDIESGGLEFTRPIIQIAAVAIDSAFQELGSIELKITFDPSTADPASLSSNKFNTDIWRREAVSPTDAANRFATFLRRHATFDMLTREGRPYRIAQLAGHNAERFDGPFLHAWYRRHDVFCPARYMTLCTKQKALWLFEEDKSLTPPTDFKLGTLCQYFGVCLRKNEAHDALVDVRATVDLYRAMREHQRRNLAKAA
jgi:DNA polymerase III epsilon subunit-like protein